MPTYVDPQSLPASFISPGDISDLWPGMAPGGGDAVVPHIVSISGRIGLRAYQWADEALRDSRVNAEKMRTDAGIMESVEALQRSTSLLNWHIVPEDDQSHEQKQLADEMTRIIRRTPDFTKFRWSLADCHWYGRSAIFPEFGKDYVGGKLRTIIKGWTPRHGDKLVFRWDDGSHEYDPNQVGIRITPSYHEVQGSRFTDQFGREHDLIEGTQYGLVRWFTPAERERIIVDKHIVEDCVFEDPQRAGGIHGVGIRDRIYWTWYGMIECLADVLSYLERSAFGVEVWTYPAGNEQARIRTEAAAKNQTSGGRTVLIVPKERGEGSEDFGVQHIEPGLGGIESAMSLIQNFFMHKIKRYILGQTLTSEAAATGLGSGVADAHMATFADIIKFLAVCREETLTRDYLRPLQIWNFPQSRGIYLRFAIDTESPDSDKKMQGYQAAWNMGAALRTEDVMSTIGAAMPKATDKVLQNPAFAQQQPQQIPGEGIEGAGQDAQGQEGSLQDLFGPLANELGSNGQGEAGGGADEPGGGQPAPNSPNGAGPAQYAESEADVEKYAERKRQVRSTPGQQPLGGIPDLNTKQHHLWREELHPRNPHGEFADKGGSSKQAQAAGALGKAPLSHQHGQGILFHELASKLHQSEESVEPHAKSIQQGLFQTLAHSDVPPEQLAALLSGDKERMEALRNHAHATGQAEMPKEPEFELRQQSVREGAPESKVPDIGGKQESFWHGMGDKSGQKKLIEGLDLAGKTGEQPPVKSDEHARALAKEAHDRHLEREKSITTPEEQNASWKQYQDDLDAAGIMPTLAGYRFRPEPKGGRQEAEAKSKIEAARKPLPPKQPEPKRELSDQEESHREYAENFDKVAQDPPKATSRNLHRAIGFTHQQERHYDRQLERGDITAEQHKNLVNGIVSERDWYGKILKDRGDYAGGGPYSDEKQPVTKKKSPSLPPIPSSALPPSKGEGKKRKRSTKE